MSSRSIRQRGRGMAGREMINRNRDDDDDEIKHLLSNLQHLLPPHPLFIIPFQGKVASARIVQEMCKYIISLRREVEDLSDTLSRLLENMDTTQPHHIID